MAADVPVVDEAVLREVLESTGDDVGFVRELIETYVADSPAQLEAMDAAVAAGDAAALVRPAHTLKSSSAAIGAMRISAVARELEMAGRSGALDPSARDALDSAKSEWQAATEGLGAWLERAAAR